MVKIKSHTALECRLLATHSTCGLNVSGAGFPKAVRYTSLLFANALARAFKNIQKIFHSVTGVTDVINYLFTPVSIGGAK